MNESESSSPESPAKEQPWEQNAAPQVSSRTQMPEQSGQRPAVAATVETLLNAAHSYDECVKDGGIVTEHIGYTFGHLFREAAALIEKLGQGWIPVEWQEFGGIPGPENEPAALVAWISVAQKEGAEALFRRMQKRLLLWEREKLSPETYEKIKDWPIYTEPPQVGLSKLWQGWIPVSERLPDVNDDVLIIDHTFGGAPVVKIATFINGPGAPASGGPWIVEDKPWVDPSGPHFHHITHWMPLPPPPERP